MKIDAAKIEMIPEFDRGLKQASHRLNLGIALVFFLGGCLITVSSEWVFYQLQAGTIGNTIQEHLAAAKPVILIMTLLVFLYSVFATLALGPYIRKILFHIREMAQAEEAKTSRLEKLVRDLREAESEARTSREKAERACAAKTEWIALISHEIRNPLSVIIGHSELLSLDRDLSRKASQSVQAIQRSGSHVLETVNDLLDISKLEAGKLDMLRSPLLLTDFLNETIEPLKFSANQKMLSFQVEISDRTPPSIITDGKRLRQIITNVVGNAIKFTDKGHVIVCVDTKSKLLDTKSSMLEIKVKDTGCGISPREASHLFKPFGQAGAAISKKFGGTGLGLALSRSLARALGGDLQLEKSAPEEGAVFVITVETGMVPN